MQECHHRRPNHPHPQSPPFLITPIPNLPDLQKAGNALVTTSGFHYVSIGGTVSFSLFTNIFGKYNISIEKTFPFALLDKLF